MILVYAFAAWYGLALINAIYGLTVEAWQTHRTRTIARALARSKKRAHARAQKSLPQPVPEGDQSWVITHDDVLLSLSPSMRKDFQSFQKDRSPNGLRADFQSATPTRGRKPRNQIYHPYMLGARQGSLSINEVRSLKAPDTKNKVGRS